MARLGMITVSQLPPFQVLETISTEAIIVARMAQVVRTWAANDPPNAAQYDVGGLEFDPIRINQEVAAYFELLLRDRVNQAARAVTLAFASGGDLDVIASRYPGGMPRLAAETPSTTATDDAYRTRVWLSPNTLSPHGTYEAYVFWALSATTELGTPVRDVQALSTPGSPNISVVLMRNGAAAQLTYNTVTATATMTTPQPDPTPTTAQILSTLQYIHSNSRKGLTDVVSVVGPQIIEESYDIGIELFPNWDVDSLMAQLTTALQDLLEAQRWLGYSHLHSAIDAALKVGGVYDVIINSPTNRDLTANQVVRVISVRLYYAGRAGIGLLSPEE